MKNLIASIFTVVVLSATFLFAQEPNAVDAVLASKSVEDELKQEIALRDSLMAVGDSACAVEKDSLRSALALGNAMSDSWKQSYETMKKDSDACARALAASKEAAEMPKEESEESGTSTAVVAGSSFLGGLGIGMLLFWLIFE